ncbi:MAG: hypothetical protein ABSE45_13430 [Candidatus Acidiferrales bacterium]|jgi:hypothetical protein
MKALAVELGISPKWIWVLRREFQRDPERQERLERTYRPGTLAELREEQEKRRLDFGERYRLPRIKRVKPIDPMKAALEEQVKAILKRQKNWIKDYGELPEGINWLE